MLALSARTTSKRLLQLLRRDERFVAFGTARHRIAPDQAHALDTTPMGDCGQENPEVICTTRPLRKVSRNP